MLVFFSDSERCPAVGFVNLLLSTNEISKLVSVVISERNPKLPHSDLEQRP